MSVTYETSFTMRGATGVIHQRHQILRLPRKMTLKIHPAHIWNVIYNARSNRHQPPTSPNTAPATQNDFQDSSCSHMKRHLQCAEQQASPSNLTKYCACHAKWLSWLILLTYEFTMRGATGINLQPHQILRLPRKIAFQNQREIVRKQLKCHLQCAADSSMIRPWSDHELVISHPPVRRGYFSHFGDAFCIENYNILRSGYLPRFHRILRLPRKVTLQHHQILRLPRKIAFQNQRKICRKQLKRQFQCGDDPNMIRPWTRHLAPARSPRLLFALRKRILYWKLQHFALRLSTQISPNTAPATKSDTPRSPNTAPATKNDSHDRYPWHMKRHLQCAEQQASPSNLTKYCACHGKRISSLILVTYETSFTFPEARTYVYMHNIGQRQLWEQHSYICSQCMQNLLTFKSPEIWGFPKSHIWLFHLFYDMCLSWFQALKAIKICPYQVSMSIVVGLCLKHKRIFWILCSGFVVNHHISRYRLSADRMVRMFVYILWKLGYV